MTYVWTVQRFVYAAFVIDAYARGSSVGGSPTTCAATWPLYALEQAVYDRLDGPAVELVVASRLAMS